MLILYRDKKLETLCTKIGKMQLFFPTPAIVKKFARLMLLLKATRHFTDFLRLPLRQSYGVHKLSGKKKGEFVLEVDSYRVEIVVEAYSKPDGEDEIRILEVSNHYGD